LALTPALLVPSTHNPNRARNPNLFSLRSITITIMIMNAKEA
jgi:hypothetical protein